MASPAPALDLEKLDRLLAADAAPKPLDVDTLAKTFHELEAAVDKARLALKEAQEPIGQQQIELVRLIRKFGSQHADKSKLLHGIAWEMMATFGQYTKQDSAAVERLRLALKKAKKARLLKKLFTVETSYRFQSNALTLIKGEQLTPKLSALVLECFDVQDRTPTLDVRQKKTALASI